MLRSSYPAYEGANVDISKAMFNGRLSYRGYLTIQPIYWYAAGRAALAIYAALAHKTLDKPTCLNR